MTAPEPKVGDNWFRYDIVGESIFLGYYAIVRRTPARVYFTNGESVLLRARKQWACSTIERAREAFIRRKERQIRIMEPMLDRARKALAAAKADGWPEKPGEWRNFDNSPSEFTFVDLELPDAS
jgi:hypothetical protein